MPSSHRTRTLVATGLLTALSGCGGGDPEHVPPPVILISLDTVRADTLSCYGGPPGSTPNLDELASASDRYSECIATAPWTLPTHASMFTGLFPFEHGTHSFLVDDVRGGNVYALHPKFETLAEALGARGYRTGGVVANAIYLRPNLGLGAGFETWDVSREPAADVTDRALEWLDRYGSEPRPTFLFVNYMDAHRPYRTGDPADRSVQKLDQLIERVMERGEAPGRLGEEVLALHQKAVTRLDGELGRLFDSLKERGLWDRSIIVVTADHGEAFGDHGIVEHSKDVYESLVRVPLLVKFPGQDVGRVDDARASSADIPGLVAQALKGTDAASLANVFRRKPGDHPVIVENYFSRTKDLARYGDRFRRQRRAVYEGHLKLVVGSDGSVELYDLFADPDESQNLADARPADVERLAERLGGLVEATAYEGDRVLPGQLTAAQRNEMNALGYGPGGSDDDVDGGSR